MALPDIGSFHLDFPDLPHQIVFVVLLPSEYCKQCHSVPFVTTFPLFRARKHQYITFNLESTSRVTTWFWTSSMQRLCASKMDTFLVATAFHGRENAECAPY